MANFLAAERRKNFAIAGRLWLTAPKNEEPRRGERIFRRYRGLCVAGTWYLNPRPVGSVAQNGESHSPLKKVGA
jgi:hypothetical protein